MNLTFDSTDATSSYFVVLFFHFPSLFDYFSEDGCLAMFTFMKFFFFLQPERELHVILKYLANFN